MLPQGRGLFLSAVGLGHQGRRQTASVAKGSISSRHRAGPSHVNSNDTEPNALSGRKEKARSRASATKVDRLLRCCAAERSNRHTDIKEPVDQRDPLGPQISNLTTSSPRLRTMTVDTLACSGSIASTAGLTRVPAWSRVSECRSFLPAAVHEMDCS
jgi:hypothetical protein